MRQPIKKSLALLLALCLTMSLLPTAALAGNETGSLTVKDIAFNKWITGQTGESITQRWIFANGTPITIEAKGTGSSIKDASGNELTPAGFVNDPTNGYDLSKAAIVGGSHGDLTGNTSVTMKSGTVGSIVGGCYGGTLTGDASVTIEGGTLSGMKYGVSTSIDQHFDTFDFSVCGGSFAGNVGASILGSAPASAAVTGTVTLTITGGTLNGKSAMIGQGVTYGYSVSNQKTVAATANKVIVNVTGGSCGALWSAYYGGDYGAATTGIFATVLGSGIEGSVKVYADHASTFYTITDTQNENRFDWTKLSDLSYLLVDDAAKTVSVSNGARVFQNYTIPAGYTLTVPTGVTLTVDAGVTVTNNGAISIKGTLNNNGTINTSSSGSIVKAGGTYTAGNGASPATDAVKGTAAAFSSLSLAAGTVRGTTKITVDAAKTGNTQYYKIFDNTPTPPGLGATISDTSTYTAVAGAGDIPVAPNSYVAVYEIATSGGTVVKYGSIQATADNIKESCAYDAFSPSPVSAGSANNTTKITATADADNSLYYSLTDAEVTGLSYNSVIDTTGKTTVSTSEDISTESGKWLSVYEVTTTGGYLRKFACVKLTPAYFTGYTGGLVADTTAKKIYCNGKTVALSAEIDDDELTTMPALYVYDGTLKKAAPKCLPFDEGADYSAYTLVGGSSTESAAAGTVYLLYSNLSRGSNSQFETIGACMPAAIEGFANYIVPALDKKSGDLDDWTNEYTVGGTIDLANVRTNHLVGSTLNMSALTINAGGKLTIPDSGITVQYAGTAGSIVRESGATTAGVNNVRFVPCVDVKFYDSTGKEFEKDAGGAYEVPEMQQVTIVAAISTNDTKASPGTTLPTPTSEEAITVSEATFFPQSQATYAFAFTKPAGIGSNWYDYYKDNTLNITTSGTELNMVTTLSLTLSAEQFEKYKGCSFLVSNYNVTSGDNVPPKYADAIKDVFYAIKKVQAPITISGAPEAVTYGESPFDLTASGGSGTGAVTWTTDNSSVASFDTNGNVIVKAVGTATITATKAGDTEYCAAEGSYTLTVNKKVPTKDDLTLTPATNLVFDNSAKTAAVEAKSNLTGFGTVSNLCYTGVAPTVYAKSATAPTNVGTYKVSVDISAGANYAAATGLEVGSFTIAKATIDAPTGGLVDDTANTLTFTPVPGYTEYEYSIDGGTTWKDCVDTDTAADTITIAVGNIAGTVKVRVKGTENYAGTPLDSAAFNASLEGTVAITGTARYGETLTAVVIGAQENAALQYQWKLGSSPIQGETNPTLRLNTSGLIGKTVTVQVTAAGYTDSLTCPATAAITKGKPTGAPAFTKITATDKTLADAALAIGTLEPDTDGYSLKWVDNNGAALPDTTVVKANTVYKWLFTPADAKNYETLSGSVTLYSVATDGGGASAPAGTTETTKNPDGSTTVTQTTTKSDGTKETVKATTNTDGTKETVTSTEKKQSDGSTIKTETTVTADAKGNSTSAASTVTTDSSTGKITIPSEVIETLVKTDGATLNIQIPGATLELDNAALKALTEQGGRTPALVITPVPFEKLPEKAQKNLEKAVTFSFNVNGGGLNFGSGTVTVTLEYTRKAADTVVVVYYVDDKGDMTKMPGVSFENGKVTYNTNHFSCYAVTEEAMPFADVNVDGYYAEAVLWAVANGVTSGTSATTFAPNATAPAPRPSPSSGVRWEARSRPQQAVPLPM